MVKMMVYIATIAPCSSKIDRHFRGNIRGLLPCYMPHDTFSVNAVGTFPPLYPFRTAARERLSIPAVSTLICNVPELVCILVSAELTEILSKRKLDLVETLITGREECNKKVRVGGGGRGRERSKQSDCRHVRHYIYSSCSAEELKVGSSDTLIANGTWIRAEVLPGQF
jgi:hypothetical protein